MQYCRKPPKKVAHFICCWTFVRSKWFTPQILLREYNGMCGNLDNNFSGWINATCAYLNEEKEREREWAKTRRCEFNLNLITVGFLNYQLCAKLYLMVAILLSLFMKIYCWFEHVNPTKWGRFYVFVFFFFVIWRLNSVLRTE